LRKGKLTSAVVVSSTQDLLDGFGGEGFIFGEGLDFESRSHGCIKTEHAEDVACWELSQPTAHIHRMAIQ
jgi:hypothetical protein